MTCCQWCLPTLSPSQRHDLWYDPSITLLYAIVVYDHHLRILIDFWAPNLPIKQNLARAVVKEPRACAADVAAAVVLRILARTESIANQIPTY